MSIIDVSTLDLVVVHSHPSRVDHRTSGATRSVGTTILVLLPIQERVRWMEGWIRPISTILSQRGDASISVFVPVRARCGGGCVWMRRGKTAISSRLLLRLVLTLPSASGDQWLYTGIPICSPGRLLGSPPARLDLNRCRSHNKGRARRCVLV